VSIVSLTETHTEDEILAWFIWINQQYDVPNRSDYYLMQIAQQVARVLSKEPKRIKLSDFKLKFGLFEKQKNKKTIEEEKKKASKHMLGSLLGWLKTAPKEKIVKPAKIPKGK